MTTQQASGWEQSSALCGAGVWAILAGLAGSGKAPLGVIELLFLFAPLVIVPLGLALARVVTPLQYKSVNTFVLFLQPPAAVLALVSFWLSPGWLAGIFAIPWFLFCAVIASAGGLALLQGKGKPLTYWAMNIGRIDLAIAGGWLVMSRFGLRPLRIQEPIVLLTAVHFHYTGFTTALLAGALLAHVQSESKVRRIIETVVMLVLVTPFVVAVGFVWSATLKMGAAIVLSASVAALAGLQFWFSGGLNNLISRIYIRLSSLAVVTGMVLAVIYAIGDWLKQDWLVIPRMASTHGLLNSLGFSLFGSIRVAHGIPSPCSKDCISRAFSTLSYSVCCELHRNFPPQA
jgi:hypothetical protein